MADGDTTFRVLVIGAGSAGLVIAQGLKKNGIAYKVFEKDEVPGARPRDWNFGIYWAQSKLQECLPTELYDRLSEVQVDSLTPGPDDILPVFNGESGDLMIPMPSPFTLRLHRKKFQRLLATGVDVHYGKCIRDIEYSDTSATAIFEDGSKETANLIIGADGARSVVRNILLGPEKAALHMSPLVSVLCLAKLPAEAAEALDVKHHRYAFTIHPNGTSFWTSAHVKYTDTKPGEAIYTFIMSWTSDKDPKELQRPAILSELKTRALAFADPFKKALLSIPDDALCWHSRLSYWPTEPWDNRHGTVTLAGDAAHPMTFHRGQGLGNALDDAAQLVKHLISLHHNDNKNIASQDTIAATITTYDTEVQQRGRQAVLASLENSLMVHDWGMLRHSALFTKGVGKDA